MVAVEEEVPSEAGSAKFRKTPYPRKNKDNDQEETEDNELADTVVLMDSKEKKLYRRKLSALSTQQKRAGIAGFVGSVLIEPRYPGFIVAFEAIKPLIVQLTSMSFRKAFKAYKFLARLQRLMSWPYPWCVVKGKPAINKTQPLLMSKLQECNRYVMFAVSAYGPRALRESGLKFPGVEVKVDDPDYLARKWFSNLNFLIISAQAKKYRPVYFLCADEKKKELILAIRGSKGMNDWITNVACKPADEGSAHPGMEKAAENLDLEVRGMIVNFLLQNPTYRIVLTGHSLGGGVATLIAARWLQRIPESLHSQIHVYSFASPCVVPEAQIGCYKSQITSVIFGRDVVPRLSYETSERMLFVLQAIINTWNAKRVVPAKTPPPVPKPTAKQPQGGRRGRISSTATSVSRSTSSNSVFTAIKQVDFTDLEPKSVDSSTPSLTSSVAMSSSTPSTGMMTGSTKASPLQSSMSSPSDADAASDDEFVTSEPVAESLKKFGRSKTLLDMTKAGDVVWSSDATERYNQAVALNVVTAYCDFSMPFNDLYKLVKRRDDELTEKIKELEDPRKPRRGSFSSKVFDFVRCGTSTEGEGESLERRRREDEILIETAHAVKKLVDQHRLKTPGLAPAGTAIFCVPKTHYVQAAMFAPERLFIYPTEESEAVPHVELSSKAQKRCAPTFIQNECAFFVHEGESLSYIAEHPYWGADGFSEHSCKNYLKAFAPELICQERKAEL